MNLEKFDREFSILLSLFKLKGFHAHDPTEFEKRLYAKLLSYNLDVRIITSRLEEEITNFEILKKTIFHTLQIKKELDKHILENFVMTQEMIRLDLSDFYVYTRMFLDGLTRSIKHSFKYMHNKNWKILKHTVTCLLNKDKLKTYKKEIGEVILKSGNAVSTGALASFGFWNIDVLVCTQKGRPVAMLRSLDDDSHIKTRLCQYEALKDDRGLEIAKQFVKGKTEGQNNVLKKYGLRTDSSVKLKIDAIDTNDMKSLRRKLMHIEGKFSQFYFKQVFQLIPEKIRPERRRGFKAYDGVNNIFNLAYELLAWKVHRALINAKLEPYLGFLHSEQFGKPSLVCDFQELYRYLMDDFVIDYCQNLANKDFKTKTETSSAKKRAKREYLNDTKTTEYTRNLNLYFEKTVEVPRIRVGKRQTIRTLINEEALLLAKYLRDERDNWTPRIASADSVMKQKFNN